MPSSMPRGALDTPWLKADRAGPRFAVNKGLIYAAPALAFTAVFFLVPMALMVVHSLAVRQGTKLDPGPTLANYARFVEKPYLAGSLLNSLELVAATVVLAVPLAFALAAAIAYAVPRRWQLTVLILCVLPFWTSYVVRTYAWLLLLSERGIFNSTLIGLGIIDAPLELVNTRTGVLIVFVHYFMMVMTLTIYVNLRQIPENYIRAARDLNASIPRVFLDIILPLSVPGIAVGIFLTLILGIGDYVTPQIIGGNREMVMPQAIVLQVGRLANTPLAAALSFILMAVVVLGVLLLGRWLKMRRV